MNEAFISSTTKDGKIENTPQKNNIYIKNPVKPIFIIGLFHIIVSVALALYLLYVYFAYGHFSILVFVVMMIWIVGAFIIISLVYICKKIIRKIL